MAVGIIGKEIKDSCKDDETMKGLLLDLLDFGLTGRQWYKEEYRNLIEKYAKEKSESDEDK